MFQARPMWREKSNHDVSHRSIGNIQQGLQVQRLRRKVLGRPVLSNMAAYRTCQPRLFSERNGVCHPVRKELPHDWGYAGYDQDSKVVHRANRDGSQLSTKFRACHRPTTSLGRHFRVSSKVPVRLSELLRGPRQMVSDSATYS